MAGIVPIYQKREEFDYYALYEERSEVYCALDHPLFSMADADMGKMCSRITSASTIATRFIATN